MWRRAKILAGLSLASWMGAVTADASQMVEHTDVAVIGAGPAGLAVGRMS